jgi:hypothetical protein
MRNRPSSHFLLIAGLIILSLIAYLAIYRSGVQRGFSPSLLLMMRDLLLFVPIGAVFIWLVRRQRYAGDLALFTVAILLFSIGQIMQYRLFTDPEYSARGKSAARLAKTNTLRQRYINEHYDAEKKRALFGDPNFQIPLGVDREDDEQYWTVWRISTSRWSVLRSLSGMRSATTCCSGCRNTAS